VDISVLMELDNAITLHDPSRCASRYSAQWRTNRVEPEPRLNDTRERLRDSTSKRRAGWGNASGTRILWIRVSRARPHPFL